MQDAVVLSQRDIARVQTAIAKLVKIGDALLGKNGHSAKAVPAKKRRKRRTPGAPDTPSS